MQAPCARDEPATARAAPRARLPSTGLRGRRARERPGHRARGPREACRPRAASAPRARPGALGRRAAGRRRARGRPRRGAAGAAVRPRRGPLPRVAPGAGPPEGRRAAVRGDVRVPEHHCRGHHDDEHGAHPAGAREHRVLHLARGVLAGDPDAPLVPRHPAARLVLRDSALDPRRFALVPSIHARIRERGGRSYLIEPELFRHEAMTRMHASEAEFVGYVLPSTLGVRIGQLLDQRPWGGAPAYVYAYWAGIDTAAHLYGPRSPEHSAEASLFDRAMERGFAGRVHGDTLVLLTADHGHAEVDPQQLIDIEGDQDLRALLRAPVAGEPRLVFLHTDRADAVRGHLERRWPGAFTIFDREDAIAEGLFGRGDPSVARRRIGEGCAMLDGPRAAARGRGDRQGG